MAVFRVEKTKDFTIMSNHHLRNTELSLKAKGLLSLMLSLPEDWDYTTKGLAHICKDGVDSITTALKELERHGYLTRQRLRYDNGQLGDIEYTIHEQPVSTENTGLSPKRENPRQVKPEQAKPKQAEPEQANPVQLNTNPLKTKKSKKDKSITYPSIYPAEPEAASRTDGMDRIELIEAYREIIKENIEYDLLVLRYGRERLDEALELMLEVILSKRPYIRIDTPSTAIPVPVPFPGHIYQTVMFLMPEIRSIPFQHTGFMELQVSKQISFPRCLNLFFGYAGHCTGTVILFIVLYLLPVME